MATRFVGALRTLAVLAGCLVCASSASAAGPPQIFATYVTDVNATAAKLHVEINPNESSTKYLFEYVTDAAFQVNGFAGAAKKPATPAGVGSGNTTVLETQSLSGLSPTTAYHYRAVASNGFGPVTGAAHTFTTEDPTNVFTPLDHRGWEMVSPVDKNGGSIQGFGQSFGGGVFQAAASGPGVLTYSSAASFGPNPQGAPAASQYLARRSAGGWSVENIATPLLSGSYGDRPEGAPYQLFSGDLSRGLLLNGRRCRGSDGECPVANPPLPGSGAPSGYENYYLRDNSSANFGALFGASDLAGLALTSSQFELNFAGATPDLAHVVLSTCAALTSDATEVPAPGGCDPAFQNLYAWNGGGLSLVNQVPVLPGETKGAALAAQSGAIASDGSRVYWTVNGDLYLLDGAQPQQVDDGQGGGGAFETASTSGSVAFFTKGEHLFRYDAATDIATDLTPGGGVLGVLGASADGSHVYYQSTSGLELWREGTTIEVAAGAGAAAIGNYHPATGTARVTPDGEHLAFLSSAELTGYENFGFQEVFLYGPPPGGGAPTLSCASCNPTGEQPKGPASIPGAIANGSGTAATRLYKPRALTDNGFRVFFDSGDSLANQDTNNRPDVYEWEAGGAGSCSRPGGCVGLVSSGRSPEPSSFVDASADGTDIFFLTESSLVLPQDPGSYDLYDFRENGGFPPPETPIPCNGDACQSLPAAPEDPTPGTLVPNSGNPPLHFPKEHKKKHHKKKQGKKNQGHKKGKRGGKK